MGILVGFGTHLEAETVEEDEVAQVAGVVLERGHGQIAARLFKEAVPGGQPARADDRQSHVALLHGQRQLFQTHTLPQKKKELRSSFLKVSSICHWHRYSSNQPNQFSKCFLFNTL